jgi:threonine/homoserine/homoserine lactone efflux protein
MDLAGLLLFAAAYFVAVAVASPGPGIAAIIARVLGRGLAGGPAFIAGFVVGDLIWFTVAAAGLIVIAQTLQPLFLVLKYAGAAWLLYLAWKIWTSPVQPLDADAAPPARDDWQAFSGALMLTLGNPKVAVFFLSIMPLVVDVGALTLPGFMELAFVIVIVITPTLGGYTLLAERARRMIRSTRDFAAINRTSAVAMGAAGIAVITR